MRPPTSTPSPESPPVTAKPTVAASSARAGPAIVASRTTAGTLTNRVLVFMMLLGLAGTAYRGDATRAPAGHQYIVAKNAGSRARQFARPRVPRPGAGT